MSNLLNTYAPAIYCLELSLVLYFVQFLVADVLRIKHRSTPGIPTEGGHESFLFRAERALANTLENWLAFVLGVGLCLLTDTSATLTNTASVVFIGARLAHMACYYARLPLWRSVAFAVGMLASAALMLGSAGRLLTSETEDPPDLRADRGPAEIPWQASGC